MSAGNVGKNKHRSQGFTIVELLIVVVVIAILALVTIVSYNGIQQRAMNSRYLSVVDVYEKAIRMYQVEHGAFPPATIETSPGVYQENVVCVGDPSSYPAGGGFSEGKCAADVMIESLPPVEEEDNYNQGSFQVSETFNEAIAPYFSQPPNVSGLVFKGTIGQMLGMDISMYRGVQYLGTDTEGNAGLVYYADGNVTCGRGDKAPPNPTMGNATACMFIIGP